MKKLFILLSLAVFAVGCCNNQQQAQVSAPPTSEATVAAVVNQLAKAMIDVDINTLQSITAEELVYGHSGGKVQNKAEFLAEILSLLPISYVSIEVENQTIQMAGDVAIVRHIFSAETRLEDGSPGSLRVGNTLVWKWEDGQWKLLVRQAYRLA